MRIGQKNAEKHARRGQALILASLSLTFLFATMGLAIDLGWAYYLKVQLQAAADSAASAAAVYAKNNGDTCSTVSCGAGYACAGTYPPTNSLQAGCLYATSNGTSAFTATLIENNTVPPGVTGNTPAMWIKATVTAAAPNLFLFGAGYHTATIAAQAIAGVTTVPAPACVYVLSATASPALQVTGTSSLTSSGCGVYVKSTGTPALSVTGSSHITATSIIVNGATSVTGTSGISPAAITGTVTDPFASLVAPVFSGCDQTSYTLANANTATISPGVYCGGITATGASVLTLNSGIYILNGGGLTVSNSSRLNATNVMFYLTATSGHTAGPVSITGSAIVNLTAPNSGTYQGVAFYQDRNVSYAAANSIANSGSGNITGTYYFPTTAFNFTGASAAATKAAFVVNTLTITGSSSLSNDSTGTYTGLAKTQATLIQ